MRSGVGWKKELELYENSPAGKAKAREVFNRFIKGEEISGEELSVQKKDGSSLWVALSVCPVKDADGNVIASRSIAVDINERKQAENLRLEKERLQYASKAKSEFLASMSHELSPELEFIEVDKQRFKQVLFRMRYLPDVKSPKYLDTNIVNGNLVDQIRDFIEILRDFLLSSDLKNHRGHRVHREKLHRSVLSECSVVEKLCSNFFSRKNFKVLEFLHDKRIKPFFKKIIGKKLDGVAMHYVFLQNTNFVGEINI